MEIKRKSDGRPLIAVHRGKSGGNIIENTTQSAQCAVLSGGDIVEFDVCAVGNETIIYHGGMQPRLLKAGPLFKLAGAKSVCSRRVYNERDFVSGYHLQTLDEYLDAVKGKCIVNLDRIWCADVAKVLQKVADHDMLSDTIIKTGVGAGDEKIMSEIAKYPQLFFMGIVRSKSQFEKLEEMATRTGLQLRGVEVIFKSEDDYLCSPEFFEYCQQKDYMTWVNAIQLDHKPDMCAGHGDDFSILQSPTKGWGWLIDRGYDIIQTDWPALVNRYLDGKIS